MVISEDYPRVLIVAARPIGGSDGTGITLQSLFEGWPPERLAQVHATEAPSNVVIRSISLPKNSVPVDSLLRTSLARVSRNLSRTGSQASLPGAVPLASSASRRAVAHANVRAALDLSPVRLSPDLQEFVQEFDPDVVYSLLGSSRMIRVATDSARFADVPLVPHFMDDWAHTLYASGELMGIARRQLRRQLVNALRIAPVGLCISDEMSVEYASEFGGEFQTYVSPTAVSDRSDRPESVAEGPVFMYAGGLHLGRWASLKQVATALKRSGGQGKLVIHAPVRDLEQLKERPDLPIVSGGALPPEGVAERLRHADVLVHVESFDSATSRFTRLSLSTKIPQYMAAGRPVLGYGPAGLASLNYLTNAGAGLVASNEAQLVSAVASLAADSELRESLGNAGHLLARARHDSAIVRSQFRMTLCRAAARR